MQQNNLENKQNEPEKYLARPFNLTVFGKETQ